MPIILGVLIIFITLWGGRLLLLSNPKLLALLLRALFWAIAGVVISVLVLSGRVINVIIGLGALIPLCLSIQRYYRQTNAQSLKEEHPFEETPLTVAQARNILGLTPHASEAEIRAAHRRMIQKVSPDNGGSEFLSNQVNEARDVLITHLQDQNL